MHIHGAAMHYRYEMRLENKFAPAAGVPDIGWRSARSRYDYEAVETEKAEKLVSHLKDIIADPSSADFGAFPLQTADQFTYTDPVDGSVAKNQGFRFVFQDGSRIIFRLSGTGSAGATIR